MHPDPSSDAAGDPWEVLKPYLSGRVVRGRTTEAVTDAMREAILDGQLPPSTWLRETEISRALGVSRTPVREALRRLSDEGLTIKTTHHGAVVTSLNVEDIIALYVVRENLEGLAARLAAGSCPPGLLGELAHVHEAMQASVVTGDFEAMAQLNLRWHRALRDAAANPYLSRFLEQVEHAIRRLPVSTFAEPGRAEDVLGEHEAIAVAIAERDGDTAEAMARAHVGRARSIRIATLMRHKDAD